MALKDEWNIVDDVFSIEIEKCVVEYSEWLNISLLFYIYKFLPKKKEQMGLIMTRLKEFSHISTDWIVFASLQNLISS